MQEDLPIDEEQFHDVQGEKQEAEHHEDKKVEQEWL